MAIQISFEEIKAAVDRAIKENLPLEIKGYRSSTGSISDYTVRLIGKDGYLKLVEQSLNQISQTWNPGEYDEHTWDSAKEQLAASWTITLNGGHNKPQPSTDKEPEPDVIQLRNMECLSRFEHEEGKTVKSKALTLAKNDIVLQLPLGSFLGQLKLQPGKVDSVKVIEQ